MMRLELYVNILRHLSEPYKWGPREIEGKALREHYDSFKKELSDAEVLVDSNDELCTLRFTIVVPSGSFFASDIDNLVSANPLSPPELFYIEEDDYFYCGDTSNAPGCVLCYFDTAKFTHILSEISDHKTSSRFIFLGKEKVEVNYKYSKEDACKLLKLQDFEEFFIQNEIHFDQKKQIIRSVLLELFCEHGRKLSISILVASFQDFFDRVKSGYDLYVSDFSFQKVKSEIEQSKSKFLERINKVVSDMQNQMLVVPVSLIAISSSYEEINLGESIKNFTLLLGGVVFAIFFILLSTNQRNTLMSIKGEVKGEFLAIKTKHSMAASLFSDPYKKLKDRFVWQYFCLDIISLIVVSLLVLSFVFYTKYCSYSLISKYSVVFYMAIFVYISYRIYKIFKDKPWDIGKLND